MQFRDLKKQYAALKEEIDQAMISVAQSSAFINGKPVKELEAQLADYVGVRHCVTCGNGTDALTLGLKALGIAKGDAVFVSDFTFFASAEVISLEGATPVFVDVDARTFNMDPRDLEQAIARTNAEGLLRPAAIITVDLFGLPANYPDIQRVAQKHGLPILEDGAQGFGGSLNGRLACSFGQIATTSFFPAKPLGCFGDGGAVFTDSDEWATLMDSLRVHGKGTFKYDNVRIGMNSRLDTLQAALLLPKFKAFRTYELEAINAAAALYTQRLKDVVVTPLIPEGYYSSWAQYTIQLPDGVDRTALQAALKEQDIPSMVYYPKPLHVQGAFQALEIGADACPVSQHLCKHVLSLPLHPYITEEEVDTVCQALINHL